jgi:hypothetical protein
MSLDHSLNPLLCLAPFDIEAALHCCLFLGSEILEFFEAVSLPEFFFFEQVHDFFLLTPTHQIQHEREV